MHAYKSHIAIQCHVDDMLFSSMLGYIYSFPLNFNHVSCVITLSTVKDLQAVGTANQDISPCCIFRVHKLAHHGFVIYSPLWLIACGLPLYESAGQCVETCPSGQVGTGDEDTLTGTCEPCEYMYTYE